MAADGMVAKSAAHAQFGHNLRNRGDAMLAKLRHVPVLVWRRLCISLLSLWIVFSLANLFWIVVPAPDIPQPTLQLASNDAFSHSPDSAAANIDINTLKSLSLFGNADVVPVEPVATVLPSIEDEARDTSLRLTLTGVLLRDDPNASEVIIADGPKQVTYGIGDELEINPRGVKIAKIMNHRVILDNRGNYESLWLYQNNNDTSRRVAPTNNRSRANFTRAAPVQVNSEYVGRAPNDEIDSVDKLVDAIRPDDGQLLPNAQQIRAITDVIKVQMHREGGQFLGYKIRPGRNREMFEQLGLQPNDIVTAVNNVSLDDTQKAMEMYRSLGQETSATLEILRDGASLTVPIALDVN